MYGLSESGVATYNDPKSPQRCKHGTAGLAHPGVEVGIFTSSGQLVPKPGEQGEVCLRGKAVIRSYWRRPDADAAGFFGEISWLFLRVPLLLICFFRLQIWQCCSPRPNPLCLG